MHLSIVVITISVIRLSSTDTKFNGESHFLCLSRQSARIDQLLLSPHAPEMKSLYPSYTLHKMHPRLLFAMHDPPEHDLSSRCYNDIASENAFDLTSEFRILWSNSRLMQPLA